MKLLDSSKRDFVSVVVPTFNSAKKLPACLKAIKKQKYPHMELLVVDNYSNDDTRSVAETFGAIIIFHKGTPAAARNVGLTQSKGNYVLFVDSDQQLGEGVVENCVWLCSKLGVDAVKIPEVFVGLNFWGKCSALWKNNVVKAGGEKGGIPRFYRKETLLRQFAFNDQLRWWEDMELYQRLKTTGLKEAWCSRQLVHFETDSPQNAVRKYMSYGRSINAFKTTEAEAPYTPTVGLTLSTAMQMLRTSGRSISVFFGCLFLVSLKTLSVALGFLLKPK